MRPMVVSVEELDQDLVAKEREILAEAARQEGKPDNIIISLSPGMADRGERLQRTFRPRAYYELDLKRGTKKLLLQGKLSLGQVEFDGEGNPWFARGYDRGKGERIADGIRRKVRNRRPAVR